MIERKQMVEIREALMGEARKIRDTLRSEVSLVSVHIVAVCESENEDSTTVSASCGNHYTKVGALVEELDRMRELGSAYDSYEDEYSDGTSDFFDCEGDNSE